MGKAPKSYELFASQFVIIEAQAGDPEMAKRRIHVLDGIELLIVMWKDEIVEEVRKARDEFAAKFNYDIDAIYREIKKTRSRVEPQIRLVST